MSTVLALRPLGLGDLLVAVPALRGIRMAFPDDRLLVATHRRFAGLLGLAGLGAEVLDARADGRRLPRLGVDVAVDLHGNGPDSLARLRATGARRVVGFGRGSWSGDAEWEPSDRSTEHERQRWCRLIVSAFGTTCDPDDIELSHPVGFDVPPGLTVIHPGAAQRSRCWPSRRFAALARRLQARGHRVVVTGGTREAALARSVADSAGLPAGRAWAGRTSVLGLAAVVAAADLVVSGDTGVAHLAAAFRRPAVTLCGPVSPTLWGPPRRPWHRVIWTGADSGHRSGANSSLRPGNAWGSTVDPRLASISVDDVERACEDATALREEVPL